MSALKKASKVGLAQDINHLLYGDGQQDYCCPERTLLLQEACQHMDIHLSLGPEELLATYLEQ